MLSTTGINSVSQARDSAYHQGTAWPWLLGSYVKPCTAVLGDASAKTLTEELIHQLETHLTEAGVGTVSEILDAIAPNKPRGCFAQAWSVAAMLDIHSMSGGPSTSTENTTHERRTKTTSGVR